MTHRQAVATAKLYSNSISVSDSQTLSLRQRCCHKEFKQDTDDPKGGVGKFCRERETAVAERRQVLDAAMASVGQAADPQTEAAVRLVAWGSGGMLRPAPEELALFRLMLLALLPRIGGILLMVERLRPDDC
jgi:hypothetical protein